MGKYLELENPIKKSHCIEEGRERRKSRNVICWWISLLQHWVRHHNGKLEQRPRFQGKEERPVKVMKN